jgi:hypothetical protein
MRLAAMVFLILPSLAMAQTARPPESVTVTGTKSREVLRGFVQSFAAPTRMTGKMARWETGICPIVAGVKPQFATFIARRLKEVAAKAGAPVNGRASCSPNIQIVFTTTPQALLDRVRDKQPYLLGYYDNTPQRDRLATVTRPIQAWYTTATQDLNGKVEVDSGKTVGPGLEIWLPCSITPGVCLVHLPNAHAVAVTGSRLGDGVRSNLHHIIIVADPDKLLDYEMGPLSDYIAMLALTQLTSLDTCQQLPSIVNMLAQGCERKTDALTETDMAYLHGLYRAAPDQSLGTQQDQVAYQMEQELKGR